MRYRSDLDGLRAFAVISVLFFHLGTGIVPGGFVGVDVFFVLSGFFITTLIFSDLQRGEFSFLNFYERRVRRIAPALLFVCAWTTALALMFLMPDELKTYAYRLLAALLSVSNIVFSHQNYFDPAAGTQPLLHTWSLGIEEQFYLLFPVLLAAAYKYRRQQLGSIVWALLIGSFIWSAIQVETRPKIAFFWLHARAWELLLGSVLALGLVPVARSQWQQELGGAAGVLGILAAAFLYNDGMPFPGPAALLPCLGTALVIWSGDNTRAAKALGARPIVFVGLISYSLYLWHWPLIVFARLVLIEPFTPAQQATLALMSLFLAVLTWRYVETPFRSRGARGLNRRTVLLTAAYGTGALAAVAVACVIARGFPVRFDDDVLKLASASADKSPLRHKCHFGDATKLAYEKSCVLGAPVEPDVVVYGDSHGAELSFALASLLKEKNQSLRELTASACSPGMDESLGKRAKCARYNDILLQHLTALPPKTIIIASNSFKWAAMYGEPFLLGLQATLRQLHSAGHRVILLGPAPNHIEELPVPGTLARRLEFGSLPQDYVFDPGVAGFRALDDKLAKIAEAEHARYVSLAALFCSLNGCRAYIDGVVMYKDDNHVSLAGERVVAQNYIAPLLWPVAAHAGSGNDLAARR